MNLLTKAIWIVGVALLIVAGFSLLPNASDFPLPTEYSTGLINAFAALKTFNRILPIDTLVIVLGFGILIKTTTKMLLPFILWTIKKFTGSGE